MEIKKENKQSRDRPFVTPTIDEKLTEVVREFVLGHLEFLVSRAEGYEVLKKPEKGPELSEKARAVKAFLTSPGRPFGCNTENAAQLVSLVLGEEISISKKRKPRENILEGVPELAFLRFKIPDRKTKIGCKNGHSVRTVSGGNSRVSREWEIEGVASEEEILEFIRTCELPGLRRLARAIEHLKDPTVCRFCGLRGSRCLCEEDSE
jgi:hypothetical protein